MNKSTSVVKAFGQVFIVGESFEDIAIGDIKVRDRSTPAIIMLLESKLTKVSTHAVRQLVTACKVELDKRSQVALSESDIEKTLLDILSYDKLCRAKVVSS